MLNGITPVAPNTVFPALSPEKQKKADEVKQILQQTLDGLKNGKTDVKAQRKAAAAARVAQIKQALKTLQQVPGMDPKAMARMIAMLAKQLAAAVKDYKAAGGTDSSVSATSSAAPSSTGDSSAPADTASIETDAGTDIAADASTHMPDEQTNAQLSLFGQTNTALTQQQKVAAAAYGKSQHVAETSSKTDKSAEKQQDNEFIRDVNSLYAQMKIMIETQRQRIKNQKDSGSIMVDPDYRDVRATDKALAEVDKAMQQIKLQTMSA